MEEKLPKSSTCESLVVHAVWVARGKCGHGADKRHRNAKA
jgi:hypothetical protein